MGVTRSLSGLGRRWMLDAGRDVQKDLGHNLLPLCPISGKNETGIRSNVILQTLYIV